MKTKVLLAIYAVILVALIGGCKKDDFKEIIGKCPEVISTDPTAGETGVPLSQIVMATFNEKMNPATITQESFTLHEGSTPVSGTVSYIDSTASFRPSSALLPFTTYTGRVESTVKDFMRSSLQEDYVWSFKTIPQLTLSANPVDGGTANTAGTYVQGSNVIVNATSYKGFTFINWTQNGTIVSSDSTFLFQMDGNKSLVANFTNQFVLILLASPVEGGSTSGWGLYNSGSSATAVASPNPGYSFVNWTENGTVVSTDANFTFNVYGNRTLVAHFTVIPTTQYNVILSSNPIAGGTTTGSGAYNTGAAVAVTATPNSGYTFTNWTEGANVVNSNASYTFTISSNRTLVAHFTAIPPTQYTVSLSSNPAIGGTTTGAGTYNSGTLVTLGATPNAGYVFSSWKEGVTTVSTDASYSINITGNRTLVANFTAIAPTQFSVTLSSLPASGGTTTGGGAYNSGASVTVRATSNAGYTFTNWKEGATIVSTDANFTFNISANRILVANFTAVAPTQFSVTLSSIPALGGTTNGAGSYNSGTSVTVRAIPNSGYSFTNWKEGATIVSTDANFTFNISANRILVANFTAVAPTQFSVTLSSNPALGGTTNGAGSYNSGTSVTVTATPNIGYSFTNWKEGATIVSTDANFTFNISANRILVANFTAVAPTQFSVTLSSNPALGGTTNGAGLYNSGTSVTVTATPNIGYTFTNWKEGATIVSTDANFTFNISANRILVANFTVETPTQFSVTLSSNPALGGTTNGAGLYNSGASVTVTAIPNSGYIFENWKEGINVVSTDANFTFNISDDRILEANFTVETLTEYSVILSSNPALGGTTNGDGTYNAGALVTITAIPNSGYVFENWKEGVNVVSLTEELIFTMPANDRTLVANFSVILGPAPTVISNVPAIDAVDVAINITVTATFDMPMDQTTITDLTFTLYEGTTPVDGDVSYSGTPTPKASFNPISDLVSGTTYTAKVTTGAKNMDGTPLENDYSWTFTTKAALPLGPGVIDLGTAGDFAALSMSGISTTGNTLITGDIGISPIDHGSFTGFSETLDGSGAFSTSIYVVGRMYAADYAVPTPAKMTTAISDMQTALTTAMGLTNTVIVDLYAGDISGRTLPPGLYKWNTGLLITNAGVTLSGGPNDTWVFQIADDLTVDNGAIVTLAGEAKPENIFWVTSTQAVLGTGVIFNGNILAQTLISLNTGATVNGRLLAQTAVTLNASTVTQP